ncbi:MAG: LysR substrate-binding domain-containing protein [Telluria sp.]|nr:LysR substrate-binding domain-containing protein [Telluria sp.]
MELKQLRYFIHVAELGSVTRAATILSVPQPAISREIRQLEVELRQTLLVRTGRGVSTTEAGKLLLAHAQGILEQVERAREELDETKGAAVGQIAIGITPSVGLSLTVPLVGAFRERFPKARLKIISGMSAHIVEWLSTGRLDVGLVYNPVPNPEIETVPLVEDQLYLIGPARPGGQEAQQGIPLAELPNYPLIIPSRPHSVRMYVETRMANEGLKMNVAWEVDGIPSILDMVRQNFGYAVLPLLALRADARHETLSANPIVAPTMATILTIATSSRRLMPPLVRATCDLLKELAPTCLQATRD